MDRSQEHNDRISESVSRRYQNDPGYAIELSRIAQERWDCKTLAEVSALYDEFAAERPQRQMIIALRNMKRDGNSGEPGLNDEQKKFVRALRQTMKALDELGDNMSGPYDAASKPYVGETQARHAPMTGTHTHDHAAHGDSNHDDGIHGGDGPHTHSNDADHNHPSQHPHHGGPQQVSFANRAEEGPSGIYGRQQSSTIGPAERRRLKDAQLRRHEEGR